MSFLILWELIWVTIFCFVELLLSYKIFCLWRIAVYWRLCNMIFWYSMLSFNKKKCVPNYSLLMYLCVKISLHVLAFIWITCHWFIIIIKVSFHREDVTVSSQCYIAFCKILILAPKILNLSPALSDFIHIKFSVGNANMIWNSFYDITISI